MEKLVGEVFATKENDVLFLIVGNDKEDEYNMVILVDFNKTVDELDLNFNEVIDREELLSKFVHVPYVDFTGNLKLKGDI